MSRKLIRTRGLFAWACGATTLLPQAAWADDAAALPKSTGDILWLVIAAILVFFMQAGFAMLESGLTRAKNAVNIMTKNLLDFCLGALVFWAIGYALMYGQSGNGFIGFDKGLIFMANVDGARDMAGAAGWFFQIVFAATAATIVSGAMAERTKLLAYLVYSVLITALLYPITGHWIWGSGGWLSALGMRDFAGSTVVHTVGAAAALAGVLAVGPRIGKYGPDGSVRTIAGHNIPMAALGTFILWFGWYGFNAGSTLVAADGVAYIAVTTTLAGAAGCLSAIVTTWLIHKKPDLTMGLNGALAGLVGITAGCASVSMGSAVIIGLCAGVLGYFAVIFFERTLKIDDPVGAIAVHGVGGAWGTLAVGLFGERNIDVLYWSSETAIADGLLMGGGLAQLGIQALGVAAVIAFSFSTSFIVFMAVKFTYGLRVDAEEEIAGLDLIEHNMQAYPVETPVQAAAFAVEASDIATLPTHALPVQSGGMRSTSAG